ncbi:MULTISPECIES: hypothetical protein [Corallincola]|uniref:Uncharacterized protein n=3 Tax=Corallincola TaxID=1775176 RepID=A0A368NQQ3_9GAMM|nr:MULTISPECIES: hypothetical protein [Corallincola]RCU52897.1 hypothetical protein DU002_02740 [Corallincola holothuriorum]TAA47949.1 hypothetical protein EXY25_01510 [Corallincola spongiicola]TCI03393.1 hypothetical protein EZV61_11020 [Corallincola luteus]
MLLDSYEAQGALFTTNFKAETSQAGLHAYRGELVLIDGEIADDSGRRKAPVKLLRDAILLAEGEKLKMIVGGFDDIADISLLLERYGQDFADDAFIFLLAPNAHCEAKTVINGISGYLLPWDAMVWAQLTEELRLEKSDFKGLKAADKVLKVFGELKDYAPRFAQLSLDEMLANATSAKKEVHGAI